MMSAHTHESYNYRNPLSYDRLSIEDVEVGKEGIVVVEDGLSRSIKKPAAAFIDDPDGNKLFDKQYLRESIIHYPPVFIGSWSKVQLRGFRTVLTSDGCWLNDSSITSIKDENRLVDTKKARFGEDAFMHWEEDTASFVKDEISLRHHKLHGSTVVLTSNEASNYGSFVFRVLPKIIALRMLKPKMCILVYAKSPNFLKMLEIAGIDGKCVLQHDPRCVYDCDHLITISNRNPSGVLDNASRSLFVEMRDRVVGSPSVDGSSKLYVSRYVQGFPGVRCMLNEDKLILELERQGFRIFHPGQHDAVQQILAFSQAKIIVGPSGSGMFNAVFARDQTRVLDIESEPHWIYAHTGLFGSCNMWFGIFQGTAVDKNWSIHHKDWNVNIDALLDSIRKLSSM